MSHATSSSMNSQRFRRRAWIAAGLALTMCVAGLLTAGGGGAAQAAPPGTVTVDYTGGVTEVTVPQTGGVEGVCVTAKGGDGGGFTNSIVGGSGGGGAIVSACMFVTPGEPLYVAPGGRGHMPGANGDNDAKGGWGYLQSSGGNGLAPSDDVSGFTSGGGGGATTIQVRSPNAPPVLVAGGGGGQGGGVEEMDSGPSGGSGGPVPQNGSLPSDAGPVAGVGGGQPDMTGGQGQPGDSDLAGWVGGGGGGGGLHGGTGGGGSVGVPNGGGYQSEGAGGGAGSSLLDSSFLQGSVQPGQPAQSADGYVELQWTGPITNELDLSTTALTAGGSLTATVYADTTGGQKYLVNQPAPQISSLVTAPGAGNRGTKADVVSGSTVAMYQAGTHTVSATVNGQALTPVQVLVSAGRTDDDNKYLAASPAQVTAGNSTSLIVTEYDAYWNPTDDATALATFKSNVSSDIFSGATVKAFQAGTHTITATVFGLPWTTQVQVVPADAVTATLATADGSTNVSVDDPITFTVTATDSYGNTYAMPADDFRLSSSGSRDEVSGNTITFLDSGPVTVTMIGGSVTAKLDLLVVGKRLGSSGTGGTSGTDTGTSNTGDPNTGSSNAAATTANAAGASSLASTGSDIYPALAVGILALLTGGLILLVSRRAG
jgi:hypothetical protein